MSTTHEETNNPLEQVLELSVPFLGIQDVLNVSLVNRHSLNHIRRLEDVWNSEYERKSKLNPTIYSVEEVFTITGFRSRFNGTPVPPSFVALDEEGGTGQIIRDPRETDAFAAMSAFENGKLLMAYVRRFQKFCDSLPIKGGLDCDETILHLHGILIVHSQYVAGRSWTFGAHLLRHPHFVVVFCVADRYFQNEEFKNSRRDAMVQHKLVGQLRHLGRHISHPRLFIALLFAALTISYSFVLAVTTLLSACVLCVFVEFLTMG